jgi:hypothetical protein
MVVLLVSVRWLRGVGEQWDEWWLLQIPLAQALAGGMIFFLVRPTRESPGTASAATGNDRGSAAMLVVRQMQRELKLRLVVALGPGLAVLLAALMVGALVAIWFQAFWAPVAQLFALFVELTLAAILAWARQWRAMWVAVAAAVAGLMFILRFMEIVYQSS